MSNQLSSSVIQGIVLSVDPSLEVFSFENSSFEIHRSTKLSAIDAETQDKIEKSLKKKDHSIVCHFKKINDHEIHVSLKS